MGNELLRRIPKTDILLNRPVLRAAGGRFSYPIVRFAVQGLLDELRRQALAGRIQAIPSPPELEAAVLSRLEENDLFHLKRVINATGVVLHTNLGRAPLGAEAAAHVARVAQGYCNLEYDLAEGKRGSRYSHVEKLLCSLTGAEAAMVVNNNAGAVFLMLNTLAKGRRVALSRGEMVEIGGSFRVPEIMRESGAELYEIGTTNKTHPADYIRAMEEGGAEVLLKVHTSNFVMQGFTREVEPRELAEIAHARGGLLLHDMGSGFLFHSEALGLSAGHAVWSSLREGADVISFSADKLLGSGQGGILLGRKEYIDRIRKNQLTRMLRIDKLSLAALEICLMLCCDAELAKERIPTLHMLTMTRERCREAAETLMEQLQSAVPAFQPKCVPVEDEAGGGSLPGVTLPGYAVSVTIPGMRAERAEALLRERSVPIIARIQQDGLLFSARTLFPGDGEEILRALREIEGRRSEP